MTDLSLLWEEIDQAVDSPVDVRKELLESVLRKLEAIPSSPDSLYAIGYARYFFPDRVTSAARQREVEFALRCAADVAPERELPRLYLGHHFYDLGRYREALSWFDGLSGRDLPPLLASRARELAVCCCMHLGEHEQVEVRMNEFLQLASSLSDYDVFPMHLVEATKGWVVRVPSRSSARLMVQKLDELIHLTNQSEVFGKDLEFLKHAVDLC